MLLEMEALIQSDRELIEKLGSTSISVRQAVPGSSLTTFAIGGVCRAVAEPHSVSDLSILIRMLGDAAIPWSILGAGSNVLVNDEGIGHWIIRLGRGFRTLEELSRDSSSVRFSVGGSYSLMSLSRELSGRGFAGLEFAGGIPASFGGAVRMNAGAHAGEIADVLESVIVVDREGRIQELTCAQLQYSYRHSALPADSIVVSGRLRLTVDDPLRIAEKRTHCLEERKLRQPLTLPSAGSVFKNPSPQQSAGWLIEQCGLKGRSIGGARISEKHANWIVNESRSARAADVRELIQLCQGEVQEKFGVPLQTEVIFW